MSFVEFLAALLHLFLVGSFTGFVAWRLRARLLPGWTGSPARLVECVTGVGLLLFVSTLLGAVDLLKVFPLVIVLGLLAVVVWLRVLPRPVGSDDPVPPSPAVSTAAQVMAFLVTFAVVAQWGAFTSYNLDHGITNFDSVWYHLPFAAEIARTGSVTGFLHTETVFLNWFYPQNSELVHAVGMVLTGKDFISIFINLGWLALGLLAGWCVGRPYGRPHLTMFGVAVLMATHTLVVREPGTAKNDIMAAALVLSAVAIMLNRSSAGNEPKGRVSPDWAMVAGGLAVGLAAGTKVTALAPALLVACAVIFATVKGKRLRASAVFLLPALLGGGWWYLRNLVEAGNPLPQVTSIGPLDLVGPQRLQVARDDFSVAHYLTDTTVWKEYLVPGLNQGFGEVWPLLLGLVLFGLILVLVNGPGRLTRTHGAVALIAILAYLFTPLGAAGPEGEPTAFSINLRFLIPALGLAVVIVPLSATFNRGWPRMALGALLLALFVGTSAGDPVLTAPGKVFGFALAMLFVAVPAVCWFGRERLSRLSGLPALSIGLGLALAVLAVFAWPLQKNYFENRYNDFEPEYGLMQAYRWANGITDSRIALAGTTAGFRQYGFFGEDLSNQVIYLGRDAAHGGFDAIGTCREFSQAVNQVDPDFLVTAPYLNFNDQEHPVDSPETLWVDLNPSIKPVRAALPDDLSHGIYVWEVTGPMDPALCSRLDPAEEYIPGLK
ncbi:MAG: hypothetical protein KDB48_01120 [Solirubrobacterales bacterium]|nr:hypothetical protein [Solirubrobacterales bacterium]HMT05780.1 hypothetical protein [Solirubrobacterales bacterium]